MPPRIIQIKVKPNSRVSLLQQNEDGTWLAQIKSPPVDGKANEELVALVAKRFEFVADAEVDGDSRLTAPAAVARQRVDRA